MTLLFYAQPYDISAEGFYFRGFDEYCERAANAKNQIGNRVEEFEIQFIDGDQIDCDLAKAWGVNQANISHFFDVAENGTKTIKSASFLPWANAVIHSNLIRLIQQILILIFIALIACGTWQLSLSKKVYSVIFQNNFKRISIMMP